MCSCPGSLCNQAHAAACDVLCVQQLMRQTMSVSWQLVVRRVQQLGPFVRAVARKANYVHVMAVCEIRCMQQLAVLGA
eukprot:1162131-Pelagomonas_calceolata.AAC.4